MSDLVKRLRREADADLFGETVCAEAADRIEELEAELRYAIGIMLSSEGSLDADQLRYLMSARQAVNWLRMASNARREDDE